MIEKQLGKTRKFLEQMRPTMSSNGHKPSYSMAPFEERKQRNETVDTYVMSHTPGHTFTVVEMLAYCGIPDTFENRKAYGGILRYKRITGRLPIDHTAKRGSIDCMGYHWRRAVRYGNLFR